MALIDKQMNIERVDNVYTPDDYSQYIKPTFEQIYEEKKLSYKTSDHYKT
jgi:hypothetical protein